jgi:hypothetical protein
MLRRAFVLAIACVAAALSGNAARAEVPLSLNSAASAAAATEAKAELTAAIAQLDEFLELGSEATTAGWKKYLRWHELTSLTQDGAPPPPAAVAALEARLAASHNGLQLPQFVSVRRALANYAAANTTALDATTAQVQAVGGYPNFYGFASQRFAAVGIENYVDRVTPVRDCILGTDIHGTARLVGQTHLVLHENPNVASFSIQLLGTAHSNTIGYNRGVTIRSTGVTRLVGDKPLAMTPGGLFGYAPRASGCTSSNIYDICANCRLVERIAWRRADRQKGEAEAIAGEHAGARLAGQMEAESRPMIAEQNYRYYQEFVNPLQEKGQFPEQLHFSSRRDRVQVQMLQADAKRPGAPNFPPPYQSYHDLALQAHETSIISYAEGIWGGYELTDLRLEKLIRDELKQEVPEELRVTLPDGTLDPDKEPWSMVFARETPVLVRFEDGGVWMAIRVETFKRGEGDVEGEYRPAITELVEISAQYGIQQTPTGATLIRDGDVRIRFPNRENSDQITIRDSATVTFMRRKFRNLFEEQFAGEGIVFQGNWARAGRLYAREVQSDAGWLTIGWDMGGVSAGAE